MKQTILALLALTLAAFSQTPSTPGQPLTLDTSSAVKRSFKIPTAKTLTLQSGSTLTIDDGTVFSFGSTAASAMRTAIGDLNATRAFTNTANRTDTSPAFIGQLGLQIDTGYWYYGNDLGAGDWSSSVIAEAGYFDGITTMAISSTGEGTVGGFYRDGGVSIAPLVAVENAASTAPGLRINGTSSGVLLQIQSSGTVTGTLAKDGVLNLGYGAVGGPSYSFYGDTDTGLYRSAANSIGFASNGANTATLSTTGLAVVGTLTVGGDVSVSKTVTAGATTGAQTINKTAGTVNFAAAATTLVVTNSLVSTSSIIIATVGTADSTMKTVTAVAASGSFTLTANAAATAETRVNFIVIN